MARDPSPPLPWVPSPSLFLDRDVHPFASSMVIWEGCNILSQGRSLPWQVDDQGYLCYRRSVLHGRGMLQFWLARGGDDLPRDPVPLRTAAEALPVLDHLDPRMACMHLIFAAHAVALERPWEEAFVVSDRQLATYLSLDKRKDLSNAGRSELIEAIAREVCQLVVAGQWPRQGRVSGFALQPDYIWRLEAVQPYPYGSDGPTTAKGFSLRIQPGQWTRWFLNRLGCQDQSGFYQYGLLPKVLLDTIMTNWQRHAGAVRLMLWLLFRSRLGGSQGITVPTLWRIAYGAATVERANYERDERKRRIRIFERDLEVLFEAGFRPIFDPVTYPVAIQPLWFRLLTLPDDSEAELEFWIDDGGQQQRITDPSPRGKWQMLERAKLLGFELPPALGQVAKDLDQRRSRKTRSRRSSKSMELSAAQIVAGRQAKGLSQRQLAAHMGKSQSWVRDVEKGRLIVQPGDRQRLWEVLGLDPKS
jgi:DNA-binding transcriptional regulator YiaG